MIKCPYCGAHFKHNGKPELQKCPGCGAALIIGSNDSQEKVNDNENR